VPADDLSTEFVAPPTGVGYKQGVVVSFDRTDASNVVQVDGADFTNLAIFNSTEVMLLEPGNVVGILTTGPTSASWWILGRITIPGTPEAATALSALAIQSVEGPQDGKFTTSEGNYVDIPGAPPGPSLDRVVVGASGRLLVIISCRVRVYLSGVGFGLDTGFGFAGFEIRDSGGATVRFGSDVDSFSVSATLGQQSGTAGTTGLTEVTGSKVILVRNLDPGTYTVTMKYRALVGGSTGSEVQFGEPVLSTLPL
jgi:hypothetical protein